MRVWIAAGKTAMLAVVLSLAAPEIAIGQQLPQESEATQPNIRQLSWLIGRWRYAEESVGSVESYGDTGTRDCAWALAETYIRCESVGVARGAARQYLFFFNYNPLERRFEMVALHSDYPRKTVYTAVLSGDGRRIDLLGPQNPRRNGGTSQSWATVTFDGDATIRWETRIHRSEQRPDEWTLSYVDVAERLP